MSTLIKGKPYMYLIVLTFLFFISSALFTRKMLNKKLNNQTYSCSSECTEGNLKFNTPLGMNLTTQCNKVDLSGEYNYTGIVRSGYLSVGRGNSALAFIFYGKKDVKDQSQLKNVPTLIWLNGGPGSSSQLGNLQELGPLLLKRKISVEMVENPYTWVNHYNVLFVDQPVGTGLSYADPAHADSFTKNLDEVANDFYYALDQLYNSNDGCFSSKNLNIPATGPLFIFGESYGGKYVPAIAKKITEEKNKKNGFLKGLKGVSIGDGFTAPFQILSQVGNYAFHLSLLDYQERIKVQTILLRAARNAANLDKLHDDFDAALDFIVEKAGDLNVYDIKIDGDYEELLQPYFRDPHIIKLYGLNSGIIYDNDAQKVYENMYTDFMKNEVNRVQYLLQNNIPVLIYNGQDDLIVQSAGTMRWVDKIRYTNINQFNDSLFKPWKLNNKIVGSWKKAGLLELRIVNNAGHMVPMDCPEAALDMAKSFVQQYKN